MGLNDGGGDRTVVHGGRVSTGLVWAGLCVLGAGAAAESDCDKYRECFCGSDAYCNRLLDYTIGPETCDDKAVQHILGYESGLNCVLDDFLEKRSRARATCPAPTTTHRPQCDFILGPTLDERIMYHIVLPLHVFLCAFPFWIYPSKPKTGATQQ